MYKILFLLILLEAGFGLWIQQHYFFYIYNILLCCCTLYYYKYYKKRNSDFPSKIVLFFVSSLMINIIACRINRGQTILQSLQEPEVLYYGYFMLYFVLCISNISVSKCEKLLKICFFSASILYLLEYFIFYPKPFINMLYFEEEEHRMRILGQICIFIGYFYYLNRFLIDKNKFNLENILGILIGFTIILTLGFRSSIIACVFTSLLLIFRQRGKNVLSVVPYLVVLTIIILVILNTDFGQETLVNMITRQKEGSTLDNEDYARVLEWNYFMNNHFISTSDFIFGSGIPNYSSAYGRQIYNLFVFNEFGEPISSVAQWRDWGIIGFSWILGMPAAIILLFFDFYMIYKKTPKQYYYISATYFFLLLIMVTTMEFFRQGAFAFHAIMLYILMKVGVPSTKSNKGKK